MFFRNVSSLIQVTSSVSDFSWDWTMNRINFLGFSYLDHWACIETSFKVLINLIRLSDFALDLKICLAYMSFWCIVRVNIDYSSLYGIMWKIYVSIDVINCSSGIVTEIQRLTHFPGESILKCSSEWVIQVLQCDLICRVAIISHWHLWVMLVMTIVIKLTVNGSQDVN